MKCAVIVSKAAGAMAAPMLQASVTPASTMRPGVTWVTRSDPAPFSSTAAPAPVTVHWAVGVR